MSLQKLRLYFTKPEITILIPAYNAQAFVCETLDSISRQTRQNLQILISVDKSDDDTALIIKKWCQEHKNIRSKIFYQKYHLGWVQNINFLLKKTKTKYFMVLPHDDILDANYIQKTIHCLKTNPNACTAFSDVQGFGSQDPLIIQNSIIGNRLKRTDDFLIHHFPAVAFRGLINRKILSDLILLPEHTLSDFGIDTIWNLQMVLKGELTRIPEVLYYKRYHAHSAHDNWNKLESDDKIHAWLVHCKDCLKTISEAKFEQNELNSLIESVKSRLVQNAYPLWEHAEISKMSATKKDSVINDLLKPIILSNKL